MANLQSKIAHTRQVVRNARAIAESLELNDEQRILAELLGLFHDLGRFPQLERHGTFRDGASFDHAAMSVRVLDEEDIWRHFTDREREILAAAIHHHNKFAIPEECTGEVLFYSQLIRDADKLDAFKKAAEGHHFVLLKLDGGSAVSPAIVEAILAGCCARYADIQKQLDIILAIVAQIYNVNFPYTFAAIRQEHYLERIFAHLPQNEDFTRMQETVQAFLDKHT
jgi:predicted hydrolase (HD superfamily)